MDKVEILERLETLILDNHIDEDLEVESVQLEDHIEDSLGLDSLDRIELMMEVEKTLGIELEENEISHLRIIQDYVDVIYDKVNA